MSKTYRNFFMLCAFVCLTIGVVTQAHAEQQCYYNQLDNAGFGHSPQEGPYPSMQACEDARSYIHGQDPGGEQTECECSGSAVPETGPYSSNPQVMMAQMMGKMLGMMLQQSLENLSNSNQQQAEQQQAQAEQQREEERARIQAALEQQHAFEASMRNMVNNDMKGPAPPEGDMSFKGAGVMAGQEMTFKDDSTNFFGENGGSGRTLQFRTPGAPEPAPKAALSQLQAANCLSRMAAQPGLSPEDSKYLADQAAEVMQGGTVTVNLSGCAGNGGVTSVPAPPPHPVRPLTHDQITLYTKLLDRVDTEQKQAVSLNQQINKLQQAQNQDAQQVVQQQQLVQQIQESPPPPTATAAPVQSNALAEAEAALQKAQQAQADDSQALTQAKNQMQQLNQQIQKSQTCMNDAQNNPQSAGQLLEKCGG